MPNILSRFNQIYEDTKTVFAIAGVPAVLNTKSMYHPCGDIRAEGSNVAVTFVPFCVTFVKGIRRSSALKLWVLVPSRMRLTEPLSGGTISLLPTVNEKVWPLFNVLGAEKIVGRGAGEPSL